MADIWLHIAMASSEERATRYIRSVQTALTRLEEFPLSGPPRDHLAAGLRTLLHGSYAAYYLFSGEDIVVVRVVHGARDLDALAASDGFGS